MKACYECSCAGDYVVQEYDETDKLVNTVIMCHICYQEAVANQGDYTYVIIKNLND